MATVVPVIEVANDGNLFCIGCPDGKIRAGLTGVMHDMSAEFVVSTKMTPFVKQMAVIFAD